VFLTHSFRLTSPAAVFTPQPLCDHTQTHTSLCFHSSLYFPTTLLSHTHTHTYTHITLLSLTTVLPNHFVITHTHTHTHITLLSLTTLHAVRTSKSVELSSSSNPSTPLKDAGVVDRPLYSVIIDMV